jgi:nucleotide-binding universal stress UspA family protein
VTDRPFRKILVPLDGSPTAERALAPALDLAHRTGVPLRLLRRAPGVEQEKVTGYLAELADRHSTVTDIETRVVDVEAIPDAIVAGVEPGVLVCMSSHGRGRSQAVMGSVTEVVLRTIGQPVLVVGPHVPEDVTFAEGRIVVCLDGSDLAERTLDPARAWSRLLDLPLWLTQVVPPSPLSDPRDVGTVESAYLTSVAHQTGDVEDWDFLHDTDPARGLADLTLSDPTALLVTATHGRTGWNRLRVGSVTARTVHRSAAPVLVVPAVSEPAVAEA